jgi:hypothetical protein
MADESKEAYTPEPGSALADIVHTENEEGFQTLIEGLQDKKYDPYGRDWEQTQLDERDLEDHRTEVHARREVSDPKFKAMDYVDLSNAAYAYLNAQREAGDNRPYDEVDAGFWTQVYPDYDSYVQARLKSNPELRVHTATQDFLDGKDTPPKI